LFLIINIYTSESPPKLVELNTSGNYIIKGNSKHYFDNGKCLIEKLQIREVTSHFRNGWIFIVIKPASLGKNDILDKFSDIYPDSIEP